MQNAGGRGLVLPAMIFILFIYKVDHWLTFYLTGNGSTAIFQRKATIISPRFRLYFFIIDDKNHTSSTGQVTM